MIQITERSLLMQKKDTRFVAQVSFEKQTPEVLLGAVKPDALYERAFFSREDKGKTAYTVNTTTWD